MRFFFIVFGDDIFFGKEVCRVDDGSLSLQVKKAVTDDVYVDICFFSGVLVAFLECILHDLAHL